MHPTPDQLAAVERWHRRHGRSWKAELRAAWESGAYHTNDDSLLQQLRNEFGPLWLIAYRPGDAQVGWLAAARLEVFYAAGYRWVNGWRIAHQNGLDMIQPYCRSKEEVRQLARSLKITLIETN